MKTALVILAAGIGSRYGEGIKQLEAVGPNGEIIVDYSIHDAIEAGFDKVVFIIRHDLEADFRRIIGDRIAKQIEVAYAFQEVTDLPDGFTLPDGRTKPWGTSHALLCAKDVVNEPFVIINADDYYGKEGFRLAHDYLVNTPAEENGRKNAALIGFILGNTLSENGGVTRGICRKDEQDRLTEIAETKNIIKTPEGAAVMRDDGLIPVDPASLVSMNMWGLFPGFLSALEARFPDFLRNMTDPRKDEFLLPVTIDEMLKAGEITVDVRQSPDKWFGVTYQEDKAAVKEAFARLIEEGVYKTPLTPEQ